ncbi:hypothetical protein BS78_08G116400 [Paspalum vaginatum]|nr:hypothetical protein BS78_08G116400 [Paspalum vaginatum]
MGTKVEGKTYMPGYFDMEDSSVNSNGNVLPYRENKPSVHLTEKFTKIASNGTVHYDNEMIKRTMLVHEATFRKQVYELHRLYKIQKELMAHFQREEFNGCPRYADALQPKPSASQALLGDAKGVWQNANPIKQSPIVINESSSQYSVSGTPLRHNTVRSQKRILDLQLPADVYAADDDDDVEILEVRPSKSLAGANDSLLGGNVRFNFKNSVGSSHMEKSWITGIHGHHSLAGHILNKPVDEPSSMKMTDFLGVGISASQNQHYASKGVNSNLLSLEGKLKEKCVGKVSGSRLFGANEEIRHSNSFQQNKGVSNASMAWYKQHCTGSSMGHYSPNDSTFNHLIFALPGFNHTLNPPWQSNSTSYLTKNHCGTAETFSAKPCISSGISMDSTPKAPNHHSLKIHGETEYQKLAPLHGNMKDIDLNDMPVDTAATWEQGSEKSMDGTSWLIKKPLNLMKSQISLSSANGHSQPLPSHALYSESRTPTGVPAVPVSVGAEKDSRCSSTLQYDINTGPSIKCEPDMELQSTKEADIDIRNLIDLNEALPSIDDLDMDAGESGEIACHEPNDPSRDSLSIDDLDMDAGESGEIACHEPNDPSRDSLAIIAAESLVEMCSVSVQPASQPDILHWFADLATSKDYTILEKDSDDDFEALTLKLQENTSNEPNSTPRITQKNNHGDGHCLTASLLVPKPRKGKGRGRRQKKSFQRDILPGLALLPKHEVSEDLHALGRSKPVTPTKLGGRKGQQPRGRRLTRSMAITLEVEEAKVSPLPASSSLVPADLDTDAPGMTRWGRTTRRCRRSRCPSSNNSSSLRVA